MTRFLVLIFFLLNSLLAEQETFPFIGVTVSTHTVDLQPTVTAPPNRLNNPASTDETTVGVQFGVQTKDYRTTFSAEGNDNFLAVDVEVDYILMDELFGTPKIRPYIGATLGYLMYDEQLITKYSENRIAEAEANDKNISIRPNDGYYGLDFGFLFYLTDSIDLDVSYHYYFVDRLEPLDTMTGATFSLHYFY